MTRCVVLVSLGHNPVGDRPRLPPDEAAAIALAAGAGLAPRLIHAGSQENVVALRRGLGLGGRSLEILDAGAKADAAAVLCKAIAEDPPDLVLCGARAETGECSGMVPYLVGAALGRPVIADCMDLRRDGSAWVARTRASGGARRVLELPSTGAVLSLAPGALDAPLGSRLAADTGTVTHCTVEAAPDPRHETEARPARRVPPPIAAPQSATVSGEVITDPEAGADAIIALLQRVGLR